MPRCNLTLKQKCQIIELSDGLSTELIAKKFHVHPTTITRTLQKRKKILEQASRVNGNFKTVQTNQRGEEHDTMVLNYIKARQDANEPLSIKDICDKAIEFAKILERSIKSRRGWWRRFKIRCNIVKSRVQKNTNCLAVSGAQNEKKSKKKKSKKISKQKEKKSYTFKIRDSICQKISNRVESSGQTEDNINTDANAVADVTNT